MMHKLIGELILIICILILNSCSLGGSRTYMLGKNDDGLNADMRMEEVISAIKSEDKDAIRAMFSEQVLNDVEDLDKRIDYLFNIMEGNIESCERIGGSASESSDHGNIIAKYDYRFNVYTEKEQYLFEIIVNTKNTDHPENIGLYSITVFNIKDTEIIFYDPGIYMPEE